MDMSVPETVKPYSDGHDYSLWSREEVFPTVDPEFRPFGPKVLIQVRRVMTTTKSGIFIPATAKETEAWNQQVGMIIAVGPLAFKNRATGQPWPEGMWGSVGQFVRFPRHVGDRITVPVDDGLGDPVVILIMEDHMLMGEYTGDPLKPRAFIE